MKLPNPTPYRTLVEALAELRKKGYTGEFKLVNGKLKCLDSEQYFSADDLEIIEIHRFEGATNPSDMSVAFAVQCSDGTRGTVVSSYGATADHDLLKFMDSVHILDRTDVAGQ